MGEIGAVDFVNNGPAAGEDRILVSVRMRPLNEKELARNDTADWECINGTTVIFRNNLPERAMLPSSYTFDRVFNHSSPTRRVYEEGAKEVALSVVSGINSTVFAYGQTSSGKTYTMSGITEYAIADIYDYIEKHKEREFVLRFSAMEIYNEAVRDLLSMDSTPLRLLDDPERGTVVEKLTEETLKDWNHMRHLLSICEAQRQIGETVLNEMSSRSHQILRLTIESSARVFTGRDHSSTLVASVNFVDLAGSERASQSVGAGTRLKEGCHINRSLLTLGTVIRKLSKGRTGHIPYRDSKLTRILQSSLGGNARTAIICTMSPARSHIEQSRNTLLFASCAKEVSTNAQVNVVMSDKALVKHLQRELARLEGELRTPAANATHYSDSLLKEKEDKIEKMEREIKELVQQRDLAQSRLENLLQVIANEQASRPWEESCAAPAPDTLNLFEDEISVSESCDGYQGLTFDFEAVTSLPNLEVNDAGYANVDAGSTDNLVDSCAYPPVKQERHIDYNDSSSLPISPKSTELITQINEAESVTYSCGDCDIDIKDVRCIQVDEPSVDQKLDLKIFSLESEEAVEPLDTCDSRDISESMPSDIQLKDICLTDSSISLFDKKYENMNKCSENVYNPCPDDSHWLSMEGFATSRGYKLTRSRSCRALVTKDASSPFWEDCSNGNTPPCRIEKIFPGRLEVIKRPPTLSFSAMTDICSADSSQNSDENAIDVQKEQYKYKTAAEENISSIRNFVEELKGRMAKLQFQKQSNDEQKESLMEKEPNVVEDARNENCVETVLEEVQVPMETAALKFEKQQREIVELWDACNVSLIHRSCFFLLFDGDPSDSVYVEVERRRLSFLKSKCFQGTDNSAVISSSKALRQERSYLSKLMLKRLSSKAREELYKQWDISVDSKQRRLQLAKKVWSNTTDMSHVRASALLVAQLDGFQEPGTVLKEMFELSFTPQRSSRSVRHSASWNPVYSMMHS